MGDDCDVCCGLGTYPIIDRHGTTLYEIECPECFGASAQPDEHKEAEEPLPHDHVPP